MLSVTAEADLMSFTFISNPRFKKKIEVEPLYNKSRFLEPHHRNAAVFA